MAANEVKLAPDFGFNNHGFCDEIPGIPFLLEVQSSLHWGIIA
jgi:hypothetical protein